MAHEKCTKKFKLEEFPVISEGKAQIVITNQKVFYNHVQEFNRDLSIAVLTIFAQDRGKEMLKENNLRNSDKTRKC